MGKQQKSNPKSFGSFVCNVLEILIFVYVLKLLAYFIEP